MICLWEFETGGIENPVNSRSPRQQQPSHTERESWMERLGYWRVVKKTICPLNWLIVAPRVANAMMAAHLGPCGRSAADRPASGMWWRCGMRDGILERTEKANMSP